MRRYLLICAQSPPFSVAKPAISISQHVFKPITSMYSSILVTLVLAIVALVLATPVPGVHKRDFNCDVKKSVNFRRDELRGEIRLT